MALSLVFSLSAVAALIPAAVQPFHRSRDASSAPWLLLAVAVAGPVLWSASLLSGDWRSDFSVALWLSIATSLVLFLLLCLIDRAALRLTPLLLPYLILVGIAATIFQNGGGRPIAAEFPPAWVVVHVIVSISTYALVTLAAVASFSVFLTERALKRKSPSTLTRLLPAVMEAERLQGGLLIASALVLLAGLCSGMALQIYGDGSALVADHKTVLSIAAFVLIVGVVLAHRKFGMRGRVAARMVLLAYLLLTLAYPGVKFVTDVLLVAPA